MGASGANANHGSQGRILFCLVTLFLLLANLRMDSGDANAQLQAAMNLVQAGSLGSYEQASDPLIQSLFVRSPGGRYFEAHDIGNSLLMVPAAVAGKALSHILPHSLTQEMAGTYGDASTGLAKCLCSLTATLFSAISCYWLFLFFSRFFSEQSSVLLTLLFAFGTIFGAYFRTSWDVLPACNSAIFLLYYSANIAEQGHPRLKDCVLAAFWLGILGLFRYSAVPFLGLSLLLLVLIKRRALSLSIVGLSAVTFAAAIFPTLLFNYIRMGSFLRPATMSPQFQDQNGFSGNIVPGLVGLWFAPNRGLFIYSPILLLILGLPWCWSKLPSDARRLLCCFTPGMLFYYVLIARLQNWGSAGWGPRYLLPVLPFIFAGSAFALIELCKRSNPARLSCAVLVVLSCSVSLLPIFINHTEAIRYDLKAVAADAKGPRQIIDTILEGRSKLLGEQRSEPAYATQKVPAVFPDLAVTRIALMLRKKSIVLATILVAFYCSMLGLLVKELIWGTAAVRAGAEAEAVSVSS